MDICSKFLKDPSLCEQCLVCALKATLDVKNARHLRGERGRTGPLGAHSSLVTSSVLQKPQPFLSERIA